MDSRTVYIGHKEPPPGTEAYIPQRFPDNRIVSSKVRCAPELNSYLNQKRYARDDVQSSGHYRKINTESMIRRTWSGGLVITITS